MRWSWKGELQDLDYYLWWLIENVKPLVLLFEKLSSSLIYNYDIQTQTWHEDCRCREYVIYAVVLQCGLVNIEFINLGSYFWKWSVSLVSFHATALRVFFCVVFSTHAYFFCCRVVCMKQIWCFLKTSSIPSGRTWRMERIEVLSYFYMGEVDHGTVACSYHLHKVQWNSNTYDSTNSLVPSFFWLGESQPC